MSNPARAFKGAEGNGRQSAEDQFGVVAVKARSVLRTSTVASLALVVLGSTASCSPGGNASAVPSSPAAYGQTGAAAIQRPLDGRLYFTRTDDGDVQAVFVAIGASERRLTSRGEVCCILRASPGHDRLLVMPGGDIEPPITGGTVNLNGGDFERIPLTDPTLNLVPQAWSPDGSRIAFEGWDDADPSRTGIYTARASDGGDLVRVTNRPGSLHDVPLDFSPDGTQLVFYHSAHPDPDPHTDGSLWVVNVDGSDAHPITTEASPPADWARWSPDGGRILFASERLSETGPIWTVSPAGTELTTVFEDPDGGFALVPDWSPDGAEIVFALGPSNDEFTHQPNAIYVISADGDDVRLVDDSPDFKRQLEWVR